MSEAFSGIFGESEQQFTDESEVNMDQSELQMLREQVETLTKENKSLAAQFEGTIAITNQLEEINNELSKVKSQNRQLIAENEDLTHRLELTIRSKDELVKQITDEKKTSSQASHENYLNAKQEIENQKAISQQQLDQAYKKINKLVADAEAAAVYNKTIEGKIDRIVQNAQRFFNQEFLSFDDLSNFLAQPRPVVQEAEPVQQQCIERAVPQDDERLQKVAAKLRSTKAKAKELALNNKELENTVAELQKQNSEIIKNQRANTVEYMTKIEEEKKVSNEKSREVVGLQKEISTLKAQVEKTQKSLKAAEEKLGAKPQVVYEKIVDTKKIEELKETFEEEKERLNNENVELNQNLAKLTCKNEELTSKLSNATCELANANKIIEKQKNDIIVISAVRDSAVKSEESLRQALHQKQPKVEQKPQPKPLITKKELDKLKGDLEAQKKENVALHVEQTKNLSTIDEQRVQIAELKQQAEAAEEETKKKVMDLNDALAKLNAKPVLTVEDLLPADIYRTNEFGTEVATEISNIANNQSLQPASKLHTIYSTIRDAHLSELNECEEKAIAFSTEIKRLNGKFSKFLVDLSVALSDEPFTMDRFEQDGGESLVTGVSSLRTSYDNMKHIFDSVQLTLQTVVQYLNIPENASANAIIAEIESIIAQYNEKKAAFDEEKKKYKALKQAYKEASQTCQAREAELLQKNDEVEQENLEIAKENEKLSSDLAAIKIQNEQLNNELNATSEKLEQLNVAFEQEVETRCSSIKEKCEKETASLKLELDEAKNAVEEANEEVDEAQEKNKELQRKIATLTNEKSQLAAALSQTKIAMEENEKELSEKFEAEKEEIKARFDSAVEELKELSEKQQEDLTKLAASKSALETKVGQVKAAYSKILTEKRKAESEAKYALEQYERDRRLTEAQCRTKIVSAENAFNAKLEELQTQKEVELRRIFTFTAENFKSFFNPTSQFNERNFRALVEQVKEELTELSSSNERIRRMCGASEKQSTEDAVALILLH